MAVFAAAAVDYNQETSDQVNFGSATDLQPVGVILLHHLEKRQLRPLNSDSRRRPFYNGFPFGHRTIGFGNLLQGYILPEIENQARNMFPNCSKMLPTV